MHRAVGERQPEHPAAARPRRRCLPHVHIEDEVRWIRLGVIWERDTFWTPALVVRTETAPIFGFSSQALWSSLVFPNEAALLEAFLITYDEMGLDEFDSVNPFFVEWVTQPPHAHEDEGALRVHDRLVERATAWGTSHRCWVPDLMPLQTDEPWPSEAIRASSVGSSRAETFRPRRAE